MKVFYLLVVVFAVISQSQGQVNWGVQVNKDIHGHDLFNRQSPKPEDCCPICKSDSRCKSWSWNNHKGGTCWIKSVSGPIISKSGNTLQIMRSESGTTGIQSNKDIVGKDVFNTRKSRAEDCYATCRNDNRCKSFSWNTHDGGTCWFKSATGPVINKSGTKLQIVKGGLVTNPHDCKNGGDGNKEELIFEENFNNLDFKRWKHEITMGGGGNSEFQLYYNSRNNSYIKNGKLFIKPTLTADHFGEHFVRNGHLNLWTKPAPNKCTNSQWNGCERRGGNGNVINPVMSARLHTRESFSFTYGRLEVEAKMPTGDWIWPAIWLLPRDSSYGTWPASGELDLVEIRGNENLVDRYGKQFGVQQMGQTMHWGPKWPYNGFPKTHASKNLYNGQTWGTGFHKYQMEWGPDIGVKFGVDGQHLFTANPSEGFWKFGKSMWKNIPDSQNPWTRGTRLAPFDKPFYIILNVAVGGTNYFGDHFINKPYPKPWKNNEGYAMTKFYNAKKHWYPTWKGENAAMQVNYVRVWKRK